MNEVVMVARSTAEVTAFREVCDRRGIRIVLEEYAGGDGVLIIGVTGGGADSDSVRLRVQRLLRGNES